LFFDILFFDILFFDILFLDILSFAIKTQCNSGVIESITACKLLIVTFWQSHCFAFL
jgi:hypothetical protein